MNTIYFGNGYYCIKDASEGYFGKAPEDMDDYESTLLAGVPNAPSKYAPTVNPALAAKRQEQVLERLVECGLFTENEPEKLWRRPGNIRNRMRRKGWMVGSAALHLQSTYNLIE